MAQIIKYLDTAKDTPMPKVVRYFFEDTKQQSKMHFSLAKKSFDPANRTISVITDKTKEGKLMFLPNLRKRNMSSAGIGLEKK